MVDLDELERLEREATPGPWTIDDPDGDRDWMSAVPESQRHDFRRYYDIEMKRTDSPTGRFYMSVPTSFEDAHFIATTRNALPDLLAELRALRARVAEMERDARLGAVVREAVGTFGPSEVESIEDITISDDGEPDGCREVIIVSREQASILSEIADALRAEEGGSDV